MSAYPRACLGCRSASVSSLGQYDLHSIVVASVHRGPYWPMGHGRENMLACCVEALWRRLLSPASQVATFCQLVSVRCPGQLSCKFHGAAWRHDVKGMHMRDKDRQAAKQVPRAGSVRAEFRKWLTCPAPEIRLKLKCQGCRLSSCSSRHAHESDIWGRRVGGWWLPVDDVRASAGRWYPFPCLRTPSPCS